jgi:hypothetical protein
VLRAGRQRGPDRDGLGVPPGRDAQLPADVQAVEQVEPQAGPQVELEFLPQVRRGIVNPAGPQLQVRHR